MLELLTDPQAWISLATLSVLEIVLGIDNIIFLSIVSARLPVHQQQTARRIGLGLALLARILLLFSLTWMIGLTAPIFAIGEFEVSWRDIVLGGGGLFLLVKGTMEMHHMLEGYGGESVAGTWGRTPRQTWEEWSEVLVPQIDLTPELFAKIRCPVLYLAASGSSRTPLEEAARLDRPYPRRPAGHPRVPLPSPRFVRPDDCAQIALEFLRSLRP